MKENLVGLLKNIKLELFAAIISVAVLFVIDVNIDIANYFSQDRLNGISAFFAITIGVYIAVITILGTTEISISKDILAKRLDNQLIYIMVMGMVEDFISAGLATFVPINDFTARLLLMFLIISIISFVKFVIILVIIFKVNMIQMAKSIDEEKRYKDDILTYLSEIEKQVKNK